jgi:Carbohydrate binding module (family 6)
MKRTINVQKLCLIALIFYGAGCNRSGYPGEYAGKPFTDSVYTQSQQRIPGRIQCEYYDIGGEGVAYHDTDSINSGSGNLNPLDGKYLNEFRKNEGVDISYTKSGGIDDNPYNMAKPEMDQLYVGWTAPGEWIRYTVQVGKAGRYVVGLMYTSNAGGSIALTVNDNPVKDSITIPSTYANADSLAWRQWHHWNYIGNLTETDLQKGKQVLTLHTLEKGNMNYDYLEFRLK